MSDTMKIRATAQGDVVMVKALFTHPMENGARKDAAGQWIPEHFIQEVVAEHNAKIVFKALWSRAVSKNPYLAFRFKGGKAGEVVKLTWLDNKGTMDSGETTIA